MDSIPNRSCLKKRDTNLIWVGEGFKKVEFSSFLSPNGYMSNICAAADIAGRLDDIFRG